jgi:molybdopterin-guanine dinucleotide biosynthesis protein A
MHHTESSPESLRGVVLAGGDSTRFGTDEDKALASIDAEPLLSRIVTVLRQTTHQKPTVVVRTPEQRATYADTLGEHNVQFVFDMPEYEGPLAGILGAAAGLNSRWLFCCGCDMPFLAPTGVRWLIDQLPREQLSHQEHRSQHDHSGRQKPIDAIAFQHPNGVVDPLHTVYRRQRVVELQHAVPRAAGPRRLLSELERVCTVSTADVPEHVPLEMSTTNVNTRRELDAVRNRISRS